MVLVNQCIPVPLTVLITIVGHLRGFFVGDKYSYNGSRSTLNLQVNPKP